MSISTVAIVFAAVLAVGLVLFIRGLRGRRVGDEPRCRRCDYNLTGLMGEQCPECGGPITDRSVVTGVRRRRWVSLVLGFALMALSGGIIGSWQYARAKNFNWLPYLPTRVVMAMGKADDAKAIAELIQRAKDKRLAKAQVRAISEIALSKLAGSTPPNVATATFVQWENLPAWRDLLAVFEGNGLLTAKQRDRFFTQLLSADLRLRGRIRQGDPLLWEFEYTLREPTTADFSSQVLVDGPSIGQQTRSIDVWPRAMHMTGVGWYERSVRFGPSQLPCDDLEPGMHTLSFALTHIISNPLVDPQSPQASWTRDVVVSAQVEVVPTEGEDPIKLAHDASLAALIARVASADFVFEVAERGDEFLTVRLELAQQLAVTLSLDVSVLVAEEETHLGLVFWPGRDDVSGRFPRVFPVRRETPDPWQLRVGLTERSADEFTLILRPSRDGALETFDCFEIWGGELRFGPVSFDDVLDTWDPKTPWVPAPQRGKWPPQSSSMVVPPPRPGGANPASQAVERSAAQAGRGLAE